MIYLLAFWPIGLIVYRCLCLVLCDGFFATSVQSAKPKRKANLQTSKEIVPGNDVKILPRRRLYVETCTERQNFNVLSRYKYIRHTYVADGLQTELRTDNENTRCRTKSRKHLSEFSALWVVGLGPLRLFPEINDLTQYNTV
jgi:hypothetical protein